MPTIRDNRVEGLLPMKKHLWADATKEWEGFRFTAYGLDWEKLEAMPLTLESGDLPPEDRRVIYRDSKTGELRVAHEPVTQDRAEDATGEQPQLTGGAIYRRLGRCKFEVPEQPGVWRLKVKTENGEVVLKGSPFNCAMLRELLALKAEGIELFSSLWFWYDSDSCKVDPGEVYCFFVVSGDRIVRESVSLKAFNSCSPLICHLSLSSFLEVCSAFDAAVLLVDPSARLSISSRVADTSVSYQV